MNAVAIALATKIAGKILVAALDIYRLHAGKPKGWRPTDDDWNDLERWADRTPEDIKRDALERRHD